MNVKMLKVFAHELTPEELKTAATAAANTFSGKRFSLPICDAVYGYGWEILLVDNSFEELPPEKPCSHTSAEF